MTEQDTIWFEKLIKDREENAKVYEKTSSGGIESSVVEKYSDQAHFIYELLQNADDTSATEARFVLKRDCLIFAHNGTRHFSVSDPDSEAEKADKANGKLGDVNAITSIGNSSKNGAKIGKFGLGFKAVFQYTDSPYIYDEDFRFRIKRLVVPELLQEDHPERKARETLFVFPFNKEGTENAFEDIALKLKELRYPLLFLHNLGIVSYNIEGERGEYRKTVEKRYKKHNAMKITVTDRQEEKRLFLFSEKAENSGEYAVGFLIDDKEKLLPANEKAFCFFPTKVTTGLRFLIHAPFLLTDSREGIQAGKEHNKDMIERLAELAADSFLRLRDIGKAEKRPLIDDNILAFIPQEEEEHEADQISFAPFHTAVDTVFRTEEILPTGRKNEFVSQKHAFWTADKNLSDIFTDKLLRELAKDDQAAWVFPTVKIASKVGDHCKSIVNDKTLIEGILEQNSANWNPFYFNFKFIFILKSTSIIIDQFHNDPDWFKRFYDWIGETGSRIDLFKEQPIFVNSKEEIVSAFNDDDTLALFLPLEDIEGDYSFIHPRLYEFDETQKILNTMGVKQPALIDEIEKFIFPKYKYTYNPAEKPHPDSDTDFKKLFHFYLRSGKTDPDFMEKFKESCIWLWTDGSGTGSSLKQAHDLYYPTDDLKAYFSLLPEYDPAFLDTEHYTTLIEEKDIDQLEQLWADLGVKKSLDLSRENITSELSKEETDLICNEKNRFGYKGRLYLRFFEETIVGCREIIEFIIESNDAEKSLLLWSVLVDFAKDRCREQSLNQVLSGVIEHWPTGQGNYKHKEEPWETPFMKELRGKAWICDKEGVFRAAKELSKDRMDPRYDVESPDAKKLLEFLKIPETRFDGLTDEERENLRLGKILAESGITEEEILQFRAEKRKKAVKATPSSSPTGDPPASSRASSGSKPSRPFSFDDEEDFDDVTDNDPVLPKTVDYDRMIERKKQKAERENRDLETMNKLQEAASGAHKYSYGWFKALLLLEAMNNGEKEQGRELSLVFGAVGKEPDTAKTIVLRQPNRFIPSFVEEMTDVPLVFVTEKGEKTLKAEAFNVGSYILKAKLKEEPTFDLALAKEVRIKVQSPQFLTESLIEGFNGLGFEDDYDMQAHLCENIKFVFGPPGTGKTTYLARDAIIPLMRDASPEKILVLAPTNKAADVLTAKITEVMGDDVSYRSWLKRFILTGDETIEKAGLVCGRDADLRSPKQVVVTTVARYPYDMIRGESLADIAWDHIIVDEASMVSLASAVFLLYHARPKSFIIAGDPFQIAPIVSIKQWQEENLYSLVGLKSFAEPRTKPHDYEVVTLTKQYRSVPAIGEIFSKYAYDGRLEHARKSSEEPLFGLSEALPVKPLNLIGFPVSSYESIFRSKQIRKSPYQVYAALFAYEFVRWLAGQIAEQKAVRIGVIAPYRVEADLIEHMLSSVTISSNVTIQVDTIHGFQGDECEIVVAVWNPPVTISDNPEIFLNRKNILNVSISRAKDCLFILVPDENTEKIDSLKYVREIEKLCVSEGCACSDAGEWEKRIFGNEHFIEENAFPTGHQSVNVYGIPEKKYEIRADDNAVDIQINEVIVKEEK